MRPPLLFDLFSDLKILPGIGKATAGHLNRLVGRRIIDLIWHCPSSTQARVGASSIKAAQPGQLVTLKVKVGAHKPPSGNISRRRPYRVLCYDDTGQLDLVFFHPRISYIQSTLPVEQVRVVSGKLDLYNGMKTMTHPDHIGLEETYRQWVGAEPVYPLTYGLTQNMVKKYISQALTLCPDLPEWILPNMLSEGKWPSWKQAILGLHRPQSDSDLDPISPLRRRLAYDEMLAGQLALQLIRAHHKQREGRGHSFGLEKREKLLNSLPFSLTQDQAKALQEIDTDMRAPSRMVRLLQGDVGSGKTIVAFLALLNGIEAGGQGALMAPTEILARQHLKTLSPWAETCGITIRCLTGNDTPSVRNDILAGLKSGDIDLIVGTHSLIQQDVLFKDLRVVVVDEQHRFGVDQRLKLAQKGKATELLVMSATPIPRTLMMTTYGDLDTSLLREKPAGRKPIDTRIIDLDRVATVVDGLRRALADEKKVYWVCPLVEESEESDLAAAEHRATLLRLSLGDDHVGLIHGRMSQAEKDAVMEQFLQGSVKVLVSTTVIEVGINVPDATIMVIEHAERFGLAQLHQLRGRIGRSDLQSICLLLYQKPLSDRAYKRLKTMRETNDGFVIAEQDLLLRGGGEILSSRQSGLPTLKVADYVCHQDLLIKAHKEAEAILSEDPNLLSERGQALRILLYLFDRDQMVHHLQGG